MGKYLKIKKFKTIILVNIQTCFKNLAWQKYEMSTNMNTTYINVECTHAFAFVLVMYYAFFVVKSF
jgi:hypothetical protein